MNAEVRKVYTPIPLLTTLVCVVLAIVLGRYYPLAKFLYYPATLAGIIPFIFSVYIFISFGRLFHKHKTTVRPGEVPSHLITEGIYRYSRNPAYVAELLLTVGTALLTGTLSSLIAPVVFFSVMQFLIIPFEERQLLSVFGEQYAQYCNNVPRWI